MSQAKISRKLFLMCCVVYSAIYIGRLNYSAALAAIATQGIFTKSQAGLIGTYFFISYGSGQLINGFLGDKLSPYKMIFTGILVSAVCNLLMVFSSGYVQMALFWGINGYAQSMIWPPILKIISSILIKEHRERAYLSIAPTVPIGTFLAYVISIICLKWFKWSSVFFIAFVILILVAVFWLIISLKASKILKAETMSAELKENKSKPNFKSFIFTTGLFIIIFPVIIHGMFKDGIMTWVPTMITEIYSVTPSFSLLLTMFLPMINLTGAYFATYLFKKYVKDEMLTAAIFIGLTLIPLIALFFIYKASAYLSVIMLALITTLTFAFNHMTITLVPVRFAKYSKASTVSGLLNSMTYLGSAISSYGFGFLSEKFNWQITIFYWIFLALAAFCLCLLSLKKWKSDWKF